MYQLSEDISMPLKMAILQSMESSGCFLGATVALSLLVCLQAAGVEVCELMAAEVKCKGFF